MLKISRTLALAKVGGFLLALINNCTTGDGLNKGRKMKIELNLWFNRTSINGHVNINAGEQVYKFSNLVTIDKFISQGIANGYATQEEFKELIETLKLDVFAHYAWIDGGNFVFWNKKNSYAQVFKNEIFKLDINKNYSKRFPHNPDTSFNFLRK